ncbi:ketose-bisphosphate aldolase [Corynebacterium choanae]|uniref:Fructose-bisphosphate aldolase n=1 Tax=Corynebacterium choanae TaxID=1862358 RepID=A0A3G6J8U0_9CORY|nr:class II fructose-bisphosphate aldolase [Corynebacterium choanae]AZA13308.1 Fructose-bisphosphate aldolase [Corynebacterium choanae]
MTRIRSARIVDDAVQGGHGVAAFNVIHLETAEALAAAADETGLPLIMQLSHNCVRFHNDQLAPIGQAMIDIAAAATAPIAVHLDHCESVELAKAAIDLGFDSVMYDGSVLPVADNIANTIQVVEYAHAAGVSVEAELGEIGGKGAHTPGVRTNPAEAKQFVADTGVDLLAVAVGSEHAMVQRTARLDMALISELHHAAGVPLVLHGSSGVPDDEIQRAITAGMTKINVSTHLNSHFTRGIRDYLTNHPQVVDSRKYLAAGRAALQAEAARLQRVLHDPTLASSPQE